MREVLEGDTHAFFRADTRDAGGHLRAPSKVDELFVNHAFGSPITPVTQVHVWKTFTWDTGIPARITSQYLSLKHLSEANTPVSSDLEEKDLELKTKNSQERIRQVHGDPLDEGDRVRIAADDLGKRDLPNLVQLSGRKSDKWVTCLVPKTVTASQSLELSANYASKSWTH